MAYDLQIGTMTVYCEASGQPQEVRQAVAWAIVNRVNDPGKRFGQTLAEVCLRRKQFSEWNDDTMNRGNLLRAARVSEDDPVLGQCKEALTGALTGTIPDPTSGSTHYHDSSIQPPPWTQGAQLTCRLGAMLFYKGVQ